MSNDALERLKQRQRPTVPDRDTSLETRQPDYSISNSIDTSTSRYLESNKATTIREPKQPQTSVVEQIQTKQSTLRLEARLSDRLTTVCRENGVSREVLLEALFHSPL